MIVRLLIKKNLHVHGLTHCGMVVIVGIFIKIISKGGFVNEKGRVVSCSCKLGTGPCVSAVAEFVA